MVRPSGQNLAAAEHFGVGVILLRPQEADGEIILRPLDRKVSPTIRRRLRAVVKLDGRCRHVFSYFSHFLSFGASDQQTARDLAPDYDGLVVPGTVASSIVMEQAASCCRSQRFRQRLTMSLTLDFPCFSNSFQRSSGRISRSPR